MTEGENQNAGFDAGRQHLGTVYAKALLGAAEKSGETERVREELDSLLDDVLAKVPNFEAMLASPRIDAAEKIDMLDRAFAGKMSPTLLTFLKVTARHGRLDCLAAVRRGLRRLYNEMYGRVEVTVRVATEPDAAVIGEIKDRLRQSLGREIDLNLKVDPELLGGLVVRVGDTVYDGSLSGELVRMRQHAVERVTHEVRDHLQRYALTG